MNVPNQFVKNWIKEHYIILITKHLKKLLNEKSINIEFLSPVIDRNNTKNIIPASIIYPTKKINFQTKSNLLTKRIVPNKFNNVNPSYKFDSFIIGPNNSLAHAASYAVCQNLGKVYNPLFIYGGTGLGKTHLLHSIGNEVKNKNPSKIVLYQTTDRFTNEFINWVENWIKKKKPTELPSVICIGVKGGRRE